MSEQVYSKTELMICVAARLFEDGATAFIGTGIPMLAAMLASKTVARNRWRQVPPRFARPKHATAGL